MAACNSRYIAQWTLKHGLVQVDLELDDDLRGCRHLEIAGDTARQFDWRAAQAAGHVPVVGVVGHLHLAIISEDRIDTDHQRSLGYTPQALVLRQVLSELVEGLRGERERVLAEDQKAIVPDVGHSGLGVFRYDDARRDVRAAILRAVGWYRPALDVDVVAGDDLVVTWRLAGQHGRRRSGCRVRS